MYLQRQYQHKGILNPYKFEQEVELRCYEPSAAMQHYVDVYFVARWNRSSSPPYIATDILTKPVVNIFFTNQGAFINGVTRGRREFIIGSVGAYAGIKFKAGGLRAFIKQPVSLLKEKTPLGDLFEGAYMGISEKLLAISDDQQLVGRIERLLDIQYPVFDYKLTLVQRAMELLESEPFITVTELARLLHMSERSVQYLFSEYVGANIKWTSMRLRLLKALQKPLTEHKPRWTEIASELNYSTHSHFINDFQQLLGILPSEYAKLIQSAK